MNVVVDVGRAMEDGMRGQYRRGVKHVLTVSVLLVLVSDRPLKSPPFSNAVSLLS